MMVLQAKLAALLAALALLTACADTPDYLEEDIPPCTPVDGATQDPCGPTLPAGNADTPSLAHHDDPFSIRSFLGEQHDYMRYGERIAAPTEYTSPFAGHVVVRATYLPGTVRCKANRTVRYLGETTEAVLPTGWVNRLQCFVDIRVNSYILGEGPPKMSVIAVTPSISRNGVTQAQQEAIERRWEQSLEGEDGEGDGIVGREAVLFLGPAFDYSVMAWEVYTTWGVNQLDDGTVMVLHPYGYVWPSPQHRAQVAMTLADFTAAVATAHASRTAKHGGRIDTSPNSPKVVLDANKLHQHHVDTGNMAHPSGPPEPPPPVRQE